MANHSLIKLNSIATPAEIENAFVKINNKRFNGRFTFNSDDDLAKTWKASQFWILEAPNTRPIKPSPMNPDENLGFCLWLHKDGRAIEVRHVIFNSWIRWIQDIFKHELAAYFFVDRFYDGHEMTGTATFQFGSSFFDYLTDRFDHPLTLDDLSFIDKYHMNHVPEGWEFIK